MIDVRFDLPKAGVFGLFARDVAFSFPFFFFFPIINFDFKSQKLLCKKKDIASYYGSFLFCPPASPFFFLRPFLRFIPGWTATVLVLGEASLPRYCP